jgi:hypothetical protein
MKKQRSCRNHTFSEDQLRQKMSELIALRARVSQAEKNSRAAKRPPNRPRVESSACSN